MSEWSNLADSILDTIKDRANDFLEANQPAKELLQDRAEELAKLSVEYVKETDDAKRAAIVTEMNIVKQTVVNELGALALNGQTASIAAFKDVVNTALGALIKYIPAILAHI